MITYEEISLIIMDLVKKVQKERDIYLSIFIGDNGVNIQVYPNDEEREDN